MYGNYPSGAGDAAAGGLFFIACMGLFAIIGLAMLVLNIWMLVDALGRQEYEFPNSNGNSKNLWVILMIVGLIVGFGWIVALVYYFKVFKVVKRGTVAPTWAQQPGAPVPPGYAPPAPPAYTPPDPPVYAPPASPVAPPRAPPTAPPVEPPMVPPAEPPAAPPAE